MARKHVVFYIVGKRVRNQSWDLLSSSMKKLCLVWKLELSDYHLSNTTFWLWCSLVKSSINRPVREFVLIFSLIILTSFLVLENFVDLINLKKRILKNLVKLEMVKNKNKLTNRTICNGFLQIHAWMLFRYSWIFFADSTYLLRPYIQYHELHGKIQLQFAPKIAKV